MAGTPFANTARKGVRNGPVSLGPNIKGSIIFIFYPAKGNEQSIRGLDSEWLPNVQLFLFLDTISLMTSLVIPLVLQLLMNPA